jgi:hypothetical protein
VASDPIRRGAARTATLVALPVAVAFVLISVFVVGGVGPSPQVAATGPVAMPTRELSDDVQVLCQLVIANLPAALAGHARRPVSAGAEQNAAYGDPPITVECGTAQPTITDPTDEVYPLSGVCWYPVVDSNHTVWTTIDRTVPVTVTVPGPSQGSAQSVAPLSDAIGTHIPLRDNVPAGCVQTPPTS